MTWQTKIYTKFSTSQESNMQHDIFSHQKSCTCKGKYSSNTLGHAGNRAPIHSFCPLSNFFLCFGPVFGAPITSDDDNKKMLFQVLAKKIPTRLSMILEIFRYCHHLNLSMFLVQGGIIYNPRCKPSISSNNFFSSMSKGSFVIYF